MILPNILFVALFFALLLGCQASSYDDFREKGRAKTRSLISELRSIRTKDQLFEHQNELMHSFNALALLLERVQEYQKLHPKDAPAPLTEIDRELSDQLRVEILRIQRLDGGREILNKCRKKS